MATILPYVQPAPAVAHLTVAEHKDFQASFNEMEIPVHMHTVAMADVLFVFIKASLASAYAMLLAHDEMLVQVI